MGLIVHSSPAVWWVHSKSDRRWHAEGECECFSVTSRPKEMLDAVEAMAKKYGEPPSDLKYGVVKD